VRGQTSSVSVHDKQTDTVGVACRPGGGDGNDNVICQYAVDYASLFLPFNTNLFTLDFQRSRAGGRIVMAAFIDSPVLSVFFRRWRWRASRPLFLALVAAQQDGRPPPRYHLVN